MEPERVLAALLGEFGRSLIAVSELMERDRRDEVVDFAVERLKPAMEKIVLPKHDFKFSEPPVPPAQRPLVLTDDDDVYRVGKTGRKILTALAQFFRPMTPEQIGFYTGLAHKGGSFVGELSALRQVGFIERGAKRYQLTQNGLAELGDYTRLPEGDALFEFWCQKLGLTAEKILRALKPERAGMTMAALGEATGLAHKGGSFIAAVTGLRKMQLVEKGGQIVKLTPDFRRMVAPVIGVFDGHRTHKVDARTGHSRQ